MTAERSLAETVAAIARGETSCEAVTRRLLECIAAREPIVCAWAHLDADHALAQARALDSATPGTAPTGPLRGVAVGIKDVFDTFDMPSRYGSPIYALHRPAADAAVVARVRALGGVVLGKTVTTEFATFTPNITTNPHNAAHTPGGSSSGSAAAVAAGMVPVAFGTQTIGSVIRPAAYCGVVGYKPSFGLLPRVGVKAISDCLDTVGCFTRSVADAAFFVGALARRRFAPEREAIAPRIGLCLTAQWPHALPETRQLFGSLGARLSKAGASVVDFTLPARYDGMTQAQDIVAAVEMEACLVDEYQRHRHLLSERLRLRLEEGARMAAQDYDAAMNLADQCRNAFADDIAQFDVLVAPSAPGAAPLGLTSTGDPVFNRTWSLLHAPCVHVPLSSAANDLPLGVQVVGRIGDDARTLACAHWIETCLRHLPA